MPLKQMATENDRSYGERYNALMRMAIANCKRGTCVGEVQNEETLYTYCLHCTATIYVKKARVSNFYYGSGGIGMIAFASDRSRGAIIHLVGQYGNAPNATTELRGDEMAGSVGTYYDDDLPLFEPKKPPIYLFPNPLWIFVYIYRFFTWIPRMRAENKRLIAENERLHREAAHQGAYR
jgi:hypothetical protein